MMMTTDQMLIGSMVAALCAAGLWQETWLLAETRKGQELVRRFGRETAHWMVRIGLALGLGLGLLLATGVINPIRWPLVPHQSSREGRAGRGEQ